MKLWNSNQGPTNTQPRYRPPPPGMAPPPPPPNPILAGEAEAMTDGQPLSPPNYNYHAQQEQPHPSYDAHQHQPPQTSYYVHRQQQQQQQHQQSSMPNTSLSNSNQPNSYAARSAAAHHSPHPHPQHSVGSAHGVQSSGSMHASSGQHSLVGSQHSANDLTNNNIGNTSSVVSNNNMNKPTSSSTNNYGNENPQQIAEQTRLLHAATQKITEYSYHMQRSMENNDVVATLENACLLLEELGDPNHGLHHKGGNRGGGGFGGGGGGNVGGMPGGPPSYYSSAGAVPPLGNYGDRSYSTGGHDNSHGVGGWITPLTPKYYYELHMRAMDEMPILEEYLLGLCHVLPTNTTNSTIADKYSGPTNYARPSTMNSGGGGGGRSSSGSRYDVVAQYSTSILYETVQYCPRVVPRLYLQICMGAVSIRSGSSTPVQVMEELAEAAKCVQCPVRGLFLRYYLLLALKDKLPDGSSLEEENESKIAELAKLVDETEEEEGETIIPPWTPVESGQDILAVSSGSGAAMLPTSPPPALPPPPPPATEGPLFPDSTSTDAPLFWDEPLGEVNISTTPAPPIIANALTNSPADATLSAVSNRNVSTTGEPAQRLGTVVDSYEFILCNLLEMNRLWIRIQHMPGDNSKETKRRRERERNDLRILVGSNLNRLSQLDGISALTYGSKILPRILEEIATCRDPLAQAYLMDCIIQVFPAEFHLETLEVFLGVCPRLREKVNVRTIMNNMIDRLMHYFQEERMGNDEEDTNDVKAMIAMHSFDMFEDCIHRVFEARGMNIPPKDVIRLYGCLLNYALKIAPNRTNLISKCVSQCAKALGTLQEQKRQSMMGQGIVLGGGTMKSMEIDMDMVAITELEKLLSVPLESVGLNVLNWPEFAVLLAFLPWKSRKKVAISMVKSITNVVGDGAEGGDASKVKNLDELEQLLNILAPLLRDEGSAALLPVIYDSSEQAAAAGGSLICRTANLMGTLGISPMFGDASVYDSQNLNGHASKQVNLREEQSSVAKLVHILQHEDTDIMYHMLNVVRRHVQPGGALRVASTFPPIVFSALRLLRLVQGLEFPDPVVMHTDVIEDEKPSNVAEEVEDTNVDAEDAQTRNNNDDVEGQAREDDKNGIGEEVKKVNKAKVKDVFESVESHEPTQLFPEFTKAAKCRKILVFLQNTVAVLAPSNAELAFKLFLEIAVATDLLAYSTKQHHRSASVEFTSISYDFLTQAFLIYEDQISESAAQIRSITSIVGSLLCCKTFEKTDYEALITKTAQYAAKLLKKQDQCRMVCLCSRLFYLGGKDDINTYRNPQRVLECLQRGLKIADACTMSSSSNVLLFVEILDYYVYYYEIDNPVITDKFVSGLIALINEHFDSISMTGCAGISETRAYYGQILNQIKRKQMEEGSKEKFGLIVC